MTAEPTPGRRRGLGRGLDALLTPSQDVSGIPEPGHDLLVEVDPSQIEVNPEQPRRHFDEVALEALSQSIATHGLLHPIVVERLDNGRLRLIAGERRLRASRRSGVHRISAIIRPAAESGRQALELALTENLVRADLSPIEEATAFARLADTFGLSHEAIALRVGRSRPAVSNSIRLLQLPAPVQTALIDGRITAGHARALLALERPEDQERLAQDIERRGLSVRQVEKAAGAGVRAAATTPTSRARSEAPPHHDTTALKRALEEVLGTPVTIERRGQGGRLIIEFFAPEDLDDLFHRLGGQDL